LSNFFPHADGSTPLTPEESEGLRLSWVLTRQDLDTAEQASILKALTRAKWQRITVEGLLDDLVLRALHRDMFGTVWTWAGRYRSSERNIGVAPEQVSTGVRDLVADAALWLAADSPYELHEAAVRFHHRLVAIHPFANGNGRHARAATDLILRASGAPPFTWGARDMRDIAAVRSDYIAALRAADAGDITALMRFVIS
jgi:Fic-DOC domain mobile mystery protein B